MGSAKDIYVAPCARQDAVRMIQTYHYSGGCVQNSKLHFGVWYNERLEGALQFGPSLDKSKIQPLVRDTPWNGFLELNRMAFSERLPRNSESRALSICLRMIRKQYPHVQWVISYADATRCGDGTIYRAAGFVLTAVKRNVHLRIMEDGTIIHDMTQKVGKGWRESYARSKGASRAEGKPLPGFQIRYIYFLHPDARERLAVDELPYSAIEQMGAGMYLGRRK